MAILQTLYFLIFRSHFNNGVPKHGLTRAKLKLLLTSYKQKYFQSGKGFSRRADNSLVIRQDNKYSVASWARHGLVLCGGIALVITIGLIMNPQWRARLALSIMPASRLALDSFTQTVETTLPEMIGIKHHSQVEPKEQAVADFVFPAHYIKATASMNKMDANEIALASYIARRYRVANVATAQLVQAAFHIGREFNLDPLLILSVAAVESSFNPYAESVAGAQGLMQVMTRVHEDKYSLLGGKKAALDPWANMRVGAQILQSCIKRAGSVEGGLKLYVGATTNTETAYGNRVLAERERMRQAIGGEQTAEVKHTFPKPVQAVIELATFELVGAEEKEEVEPADHEM